MDSTINNESPAMEVAPYLAEHLNGLGIYDWLISVTRDNDSATQRPDGEVEPSLGESDSPGHSTVFEVKDVLD